MFSHYIIYYLLKTFLCGCILTLSIKLVFSPPDLGETYECGRVLDKLDRCQIKGPLQEADSQHVLNNG